MLATEKPENIAFKFVQNLARDLSQDDLQLPGFPDVIMELHRVLSNEDTATKDIVALINSEPALAARIVQTANSAAFNVSGRKVVEPRAAVTSLGFNAVRSTATSFAMAQMNHQESLKEIRPQLESIWRTSNFVAAICRVVTKHVSNVKPDEAMAAGLFHLLGQLYILARAHFDGNNVGDEDWETVIGNWHPTIAKAILECWGMSEQVAEAAERQDSALGDDFISELMITRVLAAAKVYAQYKIEKAGATPDEARLAELETVLIGINLEGKSFMELAAEHEEEIETIRAALSMG